nr:hypothetical protein [uncultured Chitinophaga sp.]
MNNRCSSPFSFLVPPDIKIHLKNYPVISPVSSPGAKNNKKASKKEQKVAKMSKKRPKVAFYQEKPGESSGKNRAERQIFE